MHIALNDFLDDPASTAAGLVSVGVWLTKGGYTTRSCVDMSMIAFRSYVLEVGGGQEQQHLQPRARQYALDEFRSPTYLRLIPFVCSAIGGQIFAILCSGRRTGFQPTERLRRR